MRVYLDYNATTPLRPEAKAAMIEAIDSCGNPSSVHREGRIAHQCLETARGRIAKLVHTNSESVIFTSGGTEANALALRGTLQAAAVAGQRVSRLIVSEIEHDSILANAAICEDSFPGLRLTVCPVTENGQVDVTEYKRLLREGKGRALVSIMLVNNETGVVQPISELASLAHDVGALMHCDAVQAVGRLSIEMSQLGADYLTLSAHKIGGPQGIGALIATLGAPLASQISGGRQEFGRRAGTENVAAIAGFGAAATALSSQHLQCSLLADKRINLERKLKQSCPEAVIFGCEAERVANTICVAAPMVSAETMVIALDLDGFAVSAGSACSSGKMLKSHVLKAMRVDDSLAACAIRISFGWQTKDEELSAFADAWAGIVKRARSRAAA